MNKYVKQAEGTNNISTNNTNSTNSTNNMYNYNRHILCIEFPSLFSLYLLFVSLLVNL